jgi:hypothetical protein
VKKLLNPILFCIGILTNCTLFSQNSKAILFYKTGHLYHDIRQQPFTYNDFFGGINCGIEYQANNYLSLGFQYSNYLFNNPISADSRKMKTYTLISDDLFSLSLKGILKFNSKFEGQVGIEPTLRYSSVYWAEDWYFNGWEPVIHLNYKKKTEIGVNLYTAIRYIPFKKQRLSLDLYYRRGFYQNTPNFSQTGLGFGFAFYKSKAK